MIQERIVIQPDLGRRSGDLSRVTFTSAVGDRVLSGSKIHLDALRRAKFTLELPEQTASTGVAWELQADRETRKNLNVLRDETEMGAGSHRFSFQVGADAPSPLRFQLVLHSRRNESIKAVKEFTLRVWSNPRLEAL